MNALLLLAAACLSPASSKPLLRDFVGLNVHTVLFRTELYKPVARLLRNYHPVGWDLGDSPSNPTVFPSARNGVQWEQLYGSWRRAGYDVHATLMFEELPPASWTNPEQDAFAYGFCFARWFGPSSPAGLVSSIEIGNEPGTFDDALYARIYRAMAEGVRKADPKLAIATCASTHKASHRYAKSLKIFEAFPNLVDVVTVHTYPFLEEYPSWRRSHPEDERLSYLQDVREAAAWRDRHLPGKPLWITEFGYDASTREPDPSSEFAKWEDVSDEQQARYIVRSLLLMTALDVQRAYLYWFNDDDEPQLHGSSGLTRRYEPKPAFHAMAHLLATLGDYRFVRKVVERTGDLCVYEYAKGNDPSDMVWVAWCPGPSGRTARTRLPALPGKLRAVQRMPLGPAPWKTEAAAPASIGEDPVYLLWNKR